MSTLSEPRVASKPTFSHLKRTWRSWFNWIRLKRCFRIVSDSSFVTPTMRRVKFGLTKTDFQPVTGFVLEH